RVLAVIRLGEPVDHHVGAELGQHILAQRALRPAHRAVVAIPAGLGGRGAELRQDRRARLRRGRHDLARIEVPVDQRAHAGRRLRIEEERAARGARADAGEAESVPGEALGERARAHEPAAGDGIDLEQMLIVAGVQRVLRIGGGDIDAVADDAMRSGLGARRQRGGVHPCDRGEYRVAVREVHALAPQPMERRRILPCEGVGPEAVHHQPDDEPLAGEHGPLTILRHPSRKEPSPMSHGKIYGNVTETVGDTPLLYLNRLAAGMPARAAVKHEGTNPFSSVKDRIGYAMIKDAIDRGRLKPGMIIVEPTSGNTGIGLAYVAAALGYRCIFTMPDTMT